ncbi:MAG: SMC-Scp complex subunit ScpB, partial [Myxococcota bacterium]
SGIVLHEVAGGWQLRSCPTSAEDLRRFLQVKPQRLTRAALETMAIVAYRQPITRPEIEEIRGVDSGAVLKALLDRGLVQIIGKKEEPGRPLLYATTKAFLEFFNLKDLSALPTLRELYELTEESTKIVEESFPEEQTERSIKDLVDIALSAAVSDGRNEDEAAIDVLEAAMKDASSASRCAQKALGAKAEESTETGEDEPE